MRMSPRHKSTVPVKRRSRPTFQAIIAVLLACAAAGLLAACGGGGSSSSSTATSGGGSESGLGSMLPAKYKEKGELTVAMEANYPPAEFVEPGGSGIVGFEPELAEALGEALGVKISLQNTTFDSILPGISSGKYDMAMSAINVTPEREKVFDLVSYFSAGTSFFGGEGSPEISGLEELCGHSVAVQRGTIDQTFAEEQKKKCSEGGEAPVAVNVYPDQSGANLAIASARAELGMADSPVVAYEVSQSNGKLKVIGEPFESSPYGIAVQKSSGLAKPLLAAVKKVMADGTYETILKKWEIESGALEDPAINAAVE